MILQAYFENNITSLGGKINFDDFNIPINWHMHPDMIILRDIFDGLNLIEHVDFDTHHMGNILDTILTTRVHLGQ